MLGIILLIFGATFSVGLVILGWMQLTAVDGYEDENGFHQTGPNRKLRRELLHTVRGEPSGSDSPLALNPAAQAGVSLSPLSAAVPASSASCAQAIESTRG